MTNVLWQSSPGDRRSATVRGAEEFGLPRDLTIVASVSDAEDLRGQASYIQLSVPGIGPVIAWVGVPGGGQRDGHFIHPITGQTWPWGQLRKAVEHAIAFATLPLNNAPF